MGSKKFRSVEHKKVISLVNRCARAKLGIYLPDNKVIEWLALLNGINTRRNIPLAKALLITAELDYRSAKILYENELYAPSIYHLQQAVEKATKAFGLYSYLIEEEELYHKRKTTQSKTRKSVEESIAHISPKAFLIVFEKKIFRNFIPFLSDQIKNEEAKQYLKDYKEHLKYFKKAVRKPHKFIKAKDSEIRHAINLIQKITGKLDMIDNSQLASRIDSFKRCVMLRLNKSDLKDRKILIEDIKKMNIGEWDFSKFSKQALHLYTLGVITFSHYSFSRYPSYKLNPIDYKKGLGIVDSFNCVSDDVKKL